MNESAQEMSEEVVFTSDLSPGRTQDKDQVNESYFRYTGNNVLSDIESGIRTLVPEEREPIRNVTIPVGQTGEGYKTASGTNKNPDSLRHAMVTSCPEVGDKPPAILVENTENMSIYIYSNPLNPAKRWSPVTTGNA